MKASELMIGDWVKVADNEFRLGFVAGVAEVYKEAIFTESGENEGECVEEWNIEPIPLTPEILERNGFIQLKGCEKEDSVFFALSDMFAKVRWNGEKITDAIFGENILYFPAKRGLRYVHELQHALRLCGIEKEIVL